MDSGMQDVSRSNSLLNKEINVFWGEAWSCPGLVAVADKGHKDSSPLIPALAISPQGRSLVWGQVKD